MPLLAYLLARMPDRGRSLVWLAALGILASGLIGAYHAGVEAGIFEGLTQCSSMVSGRTGAIVVLVSGLGVAVSGDIDAFILTLVFLGAAIGLLRYVGDVIAHPPAMAVLAGWTVLAVWLAMRSMQWEPRP